MFLNPDLKVFKTQIHLDSDDPALRSGMTCRVEIVVETYDDAIYVPIQAVTRVAGDALVYLLDGKSVVPRKVEIGLDNNRMVRIVSGLREGEAVVLDPPLKASRRSPRRPAARSRMRPAAKPDAVDQQVPQPARCLQEERRRCQARRARVRMPAQPPGAGPKPARPTCRGRVPCLRACRIYLRNNRRRCRRG